MSCTGSFVEAGTPASQFNSASVLTDEGIMAKHTITREELLKIEEELKKAKLLDILFSYPDGPCYDILLNMVATTR